jgi:hypothetical protein
MSKRHEWVRPRRSVRSAITGYSKLPSRARKKVVAVGTGAHKRLCQALLENCQNDPMSDIEEVLVFSNFFYIYRRWPIGCPTSPHDVSRAIGH